MLPCFSADSLVYYSAREGKGQPRVLWQACELETSAKMKWTRMLKSFKVKSVVVYIASDACVDGVEQAVYCRVGKVS